jgi:hypothetical protein
MYGNITMLLSAVKPLELKKWHCGGDKFLFRFQLESDIPNAQLQLGL